MLVNRSPETDALTKNLVNWLIRNEDSNKVLNVITAHMPNSGYFQHYSKTKIWLEANYPKQYTLNDYKACDYEALSACIDTLQPDLIIYSHTTDGEKEFDAVEDSLNKARNLNIPIVATNYSRNSNSMMSELYRFMGLSVVSNYTPINQLNNMTVAELQQPDTDLVAIEQLLNNLKSGDFDTETLSGCTIDMSQYFATN